MSAAIIIGAQTAGRVIGRFGPRTLLFVGLGMSAAGFAWLTQLTAASSYVERRSRRDAADLLRRSDCPSRRWRLRRPRAVHWTQAGLASGVLNTSRQVGGSIGLAVLATIAIARTGAETSPEAFTAGYDRAFAGAAIVCAAAAIAASFIPRRDRTPS